MIVVHAAVPARPVALTVVPAHVALAGNARAAIRVTNGGTKRVRIDVSHAGFALDLRGRPRIVRADRARSAVTWLTVRPTRFTLAARGSASLIVSSRLPRRAEPGDHDALVLLSTRRIAGARVAVRVRMGVVVVVRAPGRVVRRLELGGLTVTRPGPRRALDVAVANRGNVTESLHRPRIVLARDARLVATLVAGNRDVRPHTRGLVEFRLRRKLRGTLTVRVVIPAEPGRAAIRRTYRIRL